MTKQEVLNALRKNYNDLVIQREATESPMAFVKLEAQARQLNSTIGFIERYLDDKKPEEAKVEPKAEQEKVKVEEKEVPKNKNKE